MDKKLLCFPMSLCQTSRSWEVTENCSIKEAQITRSLFLLNRRSYFSCNQMLVRPSRIFILYLAGSRLSTAPWRLSRRFARRANGLTASGMDIFILPGHTIRTTMKEAGSKQGEKERAGNALNDGATASPDGPPSQAYLAFARGKWRGIVSKFEKAQQL
jgi:hypothetical protein